MEELQDRIREYERQGVQATALVQVAARKVAWENTQLRDLLATKGVSEQEVQEFLHHRERALQVQGQSAGSTVAGQHHQGGVLAREQEGKDVGFAEAGSSSLQPPQPWEQQNYGPSQQYSAYNGSAFKAETRQSELMPSTISPHYPHDAPQSPSDREAALWEMSCETAAGIIAGMRVDGDTEQARSQLGCNGARECHVRNSTVLQVMEQMD